MARSYGVVYSTVWDVGSDFRTMTVDEQWCYMMLVSQPQIDNLGVLPYVPEKWVRLAGDMTLERLAEALDGLTRRLMVIVDYDLCELLVRTFIRHDKVWSQPKLVANARKLYNTVESQRIRIVLAQAHPWLVEKWSKEQIEQHEQRQETPSTEPPETPFLVLEETPFPPARAARAEPEPRPGPDPGPYPSAERPLENLDFKIPELRSVS